MNRLLRIVAAAVLAGELLALLPAPARAQYPRLGLYGSQRGWGYPLWDLNGALIETALDQFARYHEVVVEAYPITPNRPDAIAAIRQRRPDIKLLAWVAGHDMCCIYQDSDSLVSVRMRHRRLLNDLDGWLYNTRGGYYAVSNVNLAKRDPGGRLIIAEGLADIFYDAVTRSGLWDGIFIDIFCDAIAWSQTPSESIDVRRAGYSSVQDFDASWTAAGDTLANRLRRLSGPDFILVGNCGQGTKYESFNGWMRENFPFQNGGDWYENMFRVTGGYFTDERRFRAPRSNYLFSAVEDHTQPYSPTNARKVRFGLGSASLGDGFAAFGHSSRDAAVAPYHEWWYDEYAVNLATGRSSRLIEHTGWLGEPLGPYGQMVWLGPGPDAVTNPDFETDVTSGWSFLQGVPTRLERDSTTAASGASSARVTVTVAASAAWAITLGSVGTINVNAYSPCSATFWAKAAVPRTIRVAAGRVGGGSFTSRAIMISTEWRRYQVTLTPYDSGPAMLQFFLAGEVGDVWLDDAHLRNGVSSVYRRDFQNGIVLVNPAGNTMQVTLERPFKRILGTVAPTVNDGAIVTQVSVHPSDALFLIGEDRIPPAAIRNLHPVR